MAKRAVGLRGRAVVALLLAAFVIVTSLVVWRRSVGISESETVRALDKQRVELEGERARLESQIRGMSTREHLGAVAEQRLRMHVPSERQVVILTRNRENGAR